MSEVRSPCLSSLLSARSIPFDGDHPSGPSRPPFRLKAKSGRLQPGMGGRLQTDSVVAFKRIGWSPWTGIRSEGDAPLPRKAATTRTIPSGKPFEAGKRRSLVCPVYFEGEVRMGP